VNISELIYYNNNWSYYAENYTDFIYFQAYSCFLHQSKVKMQE